MERIVAEQRLPAILKSKNSESTIKDLLEDIFWKLFTQDASSIW